MLVAELSVRERDDLVRCREILREGSKSFHAASLLLPARVRAPASAVYAFCRVADDAVDAVSPREAPASLERLRGRLDRAYAGAPNDHPVDRAFADVVRRYDIPRAVPDALLEGFAWDVEGRRYETLSDVLAYSARVASAVGVMMTLLMGPRARGVHARACDLGAAMQLTNICRDVGEDARNGRVYLPTDWLVEEGIDPDAFVRDPRFTPALGRVVRRLGSGLSISEIARELGVGTETIRTHTKRAMQKTDTHRQAELVALVLRVGSGVG